MNASDEVPSRLRTMQIIAFAILSGVGFFVVVAVYLVGVQNGGRGLAVRGHTPILSLLAIVFLSVAAVVSFILPQAFMRSQLRRMAAGTWRPSLSTRGGAVPTTEAGQLLQVRQTALILGLAIIEGASFFAAIAYLMEGQWWALVLAVIGICLMLARFPTEGGVRNWLEEQSNALAGMRQERGVL